MVDSTALTINIGILINFLKKDTFLYRNIAKVSPTRAIPKIERNSSVFIAISIILLLVGLPGLEPGTFPLSEERSNHLSYKPTIDV